MGSTGSLTNTAATQQQSVTSLVSNQPTTQSQQREESFVEQAAMVAVAIGFLYFLCPNLSSIELPFLQRP